MVAVLDFNSSTMRQRAESRSFSEVVDAALERERDNQTPRKYLGASLIGEECLRRIQYDYEGKPQDFPPEAKTLRIFARGHALEKVRRDQLRAAGFTVLERRPSNNEIIGFSDAGGRFRGHVDGVISAGPDCLTYPALWEHKALGSKGWRALEKHGLTHQYPKYADQLAVYQAQLDLTNDAVFEATNADTMEVLTLFVPFDQGRAQASIDKAATVLRMCDAKERAPRISDDPEFFVCKFCPFRTVCHNPHTPNLNDPLPF